MFDFHIDVGGARELSSGRLPRSYLGNYIDGLIRRWSCGSLLVFLCWRWGIGRVIPTLVRSRMRQVVRHRGSHTDIMLIIAYSTALVPRQRRRTSTRRERVRRRDIVIRVRRRRRWWWRR